MISLTGVSLKLKDKRVDKLIKKIDYSNPIIYYSPIKSWLVFWLMLILSSFGFILILIIYLWKIALIYFLITYLIIAKLNNSFVITHDELLVINTHLPFRKINQYQFKHIQKIRIADDKLKILKWLGIFECNYIELHINNKVYRYFCFFLSLDAFDENWTEKTIDDFHHDLKVKNVKVNFELEDA